MRWTHAFLFRDAKMLDLGVPYGQQSDGKSINNSDVIICTCTRNIGPIEVDRAYRWEMGRWADLNSLLQNRAPGRITDGMINDRGEIACTCETWGSIRPCLLIPLKR